MSIKDSLRAGEHRALSITADGFILWIIRHSEKEMMHGTYQSLPGTSLRTGQRGVEIR